MRFCARCNQEQIGANRYCTVCGTELQDSPEGGPGKPGAVPTETFAIPRPPAPERQPAQVPAPGAGSPPDPLATRTVFSPQASYSPAAPPAPPAGPAFPGQYQPGGYGPVGGYTPPGGYPPPADFPGGPGRPRSGKTVALVAGAIVVVIAAGVGAFALVSHLHSGSSPQQSSTGTPPNGTSGTVTTSPSTASPATTPPSSSTGTTSGPPGTVTLAPAAASSPYASQVQTLFNTYFDAINTHNYAEFASTLDAGMQAKNPQSSFDSGYSTTADSNETITSISGSASGLTAVVTFTSRQDPSSSPDHSACNNYQLTLPLVPQGTGYVITAPPPHYAAYSDC